MHGPVEFVISEFDSYHFKNMVQQLDDRNFKFQTDPRNFIMNFIQKWNKQQIFLSWMLKTKCYCDTYAIMWQHKITLATKIWLFFLRYSFIEVVSKISNSKLPRNYLWIYIKIKYDTLVSSTWITQSYFRISFWRVAILSFIHWHYKNEI